MAKPEKGTTIPLSVGRKVIHELLYHACKVPSLPLARACRIPELVDARRAATAPPSWVAIFLRAYGLVAQKHPALRRAWIPYPYPRLYEHPRSEAVVPVERSWEGMPTVFQGMIHGPETMSLAAVDRCLRHYQQADVWSIAQFRRYIRLGKVPWLFRRLAFSSSLYFSGSARARRFGTFAISSLGNLGVDQIHPLAALTTYVTFGPISPDGDVVVKVIYDHRVMDGRTAARALVDLERVLNTAMVSEVRRVVESAVTPTPHAAP